VFGIDTARHGTMAFVPKYAAAQPTPPDRAAGAMSVFGANASKSAVIRYLAMHPEGATSGTIARDLQIAYHTALRHLVSLESEGVVKSDAPADSRAGHRLTYTVDLDELSAQLDTYTRYLTGE